MKALTAAIIIFIVVNCIPLSIIWMNKILFNVTVTPVGILVLEIGFFCISVVATRLAYKVIKESE